MIAQIRLNPGRQQDALLNNSRGDSSARSQAVVVVAAVAVHRGVDPVALPPHGDMAAKDLILGACLRLLVRP